MKYTELEDSYDFHRNMRKTPWLKLFPHWWDEKDALLNAIGDEVERIKALSLFGLLNAGIKPPVLIWQESLKHDIYNFNQDITQLPATIKIQAPLYKAWGVITLTNHTKDDIDGITVTLDETHGLAINQMISENDVITIDLVNNKVKINEKVIKPQKIGQGIPYFITSQNNKKYIDGTPLHNEVIKLKINTDTNLENTTVTNTINVTEKMENWAVNGNAYRYNSAGADPWIAIESNSKISYNLNFDNISHISFWYKGDATDILYCHANDELVFQKQVNTSWTYYDINTSDIYGIGSLDFITGDSEGIIYINDIKYDETSTYNSKCDINVDVNINNAVFTNEQNIEVTGLELIPIEKIELYVKYDFPFNPSYNGWQKAYEKTYDSNTNVIYDMITTPLYTKEFYVDVWFKTLQYPYRVGFPCYQDAPNDSMYHVNNRLDTWGEQLGLERRLYKTDIPEEEYYNTFPIFYPYDIEQDYWYYKRLINEYTWNDLAINDVDIKDTEGNNVVRLYSINPFCEDFLVHAQSNYPVDKEFSDCNTYYPVLISQQSTKGYVAQSQYNNITNLLGYNQYAANITLSNQSDNEDIIYRTRGNERFVTKDADGKDYILTEEEVIKAKKKALATSDPIKSSAHVSQELMTFFDLTDLPEDVNIDDIKITVEAESNDNKVNKYSNEKTGLIIPSLNGAEDTFIPLTADKSYQLRKQSITYSIDESSSLQKLITGIDQNIIQKATIGAFEGRIVFKDNKPSYVNFVEIPFTLTENDEVVEDITDIWVYFNKTLKKGQLRTRNNGKTYIYVGIPNQAITTEMTIIVKSETHQPFSTKIDIAKLNKYITDDDGNSILDHQYIQGPLVDNNPVDIEISEEWHTKDIRNIIQKQGIFFRNVFQNDDEQSSTSINLYNIGLTVCYSPKKSYFNLETDINIKGVERPAVGQYEVKIHNIGEKTLKTSIDIITPPNITLSQDGIARNSIDVELDVNDETSEKFDIIPEYPIVDGFYDIFTYCEDVVKRDSISVFSDGLLKTSVIIQPHHGKYNEEIELSAEVKATDGSKISGSTHLVQFYINGYSVGDPVVVDNNKATTIITPGNYNFTGTGNLQLDARYLGSIKYASSTGRTTIFISKNNTRITLNAPSKAVYKASYQAEAIVEYFDGENYKPVDDGVVDFYVNDEILSSNTTSDYSNGRFITSIDSLMNPPKDYTLRAQYTGSNLYSSAETTQNLEIIGGDVIVYVFDIEAKPYDTIKLKAQVVDKNNKSLPGGFLDFHCDDLNIINNFTDIPIKDGIGVTPAFEVPVVLNNDESSKSFRVQAFYHGAQTNAYNDGEGVGVLTIKKSSVIIEAPTLYQASQYEPLGFFLKIKDAITNEYINTGTVKITLPNQNNLTLTGEVDEDGGVRITHNLISFTAKEWRNLNKFSFSTAGDNTQHQIDIINDLNINTYDGPYNAKNLYKIYDGDFSDLTLVDFDLSDDKQYLIYKGHTDDNEPELEREVNEYIFIGDDGCLYARTDIDDLRQYITGLQNIKIEYLSNDKYKASTLLLDNGLNIASQKADLDIHSYDLSYIDTDVISCYVTKYDNEEENVPLNTGSVQFIFDNKIIDTVQVVNGTAVLKNDLLLYVSPGNHLFEVDYIDEDILTTRSYSLFNLRQIELPAPTIMIDRIVKNKNSQIIVLLQGASNVNIPLNGIVNLYLDDELIGESYLYGNEQLAGIVQYDGDLSDLVDYTACAIFNYIMPDDIDINAHTLKAVYEGNEFYKPTQNTKTIKQIPSNVIISSDDIDFSTSNRTNPAINVAQNEKHLIDFLVTCADDDINEGILYLKEDDEHIISSSNVVNNVATLELIPENTGPYSLILEYKNIEDGSPFEKHYNTKTTTITFNVIEGLDEISLPNENYKTLKQALMCIKRNGIIYLNEDITLTKTLTINQDCNIIGGNDVCINNITDNIKIINNAKLHFNNIHFTSPDGILQILNNNYMVINRSILDANINIHNNGELMAQRNFIYGTCTGAQSDLNNNWWGSNTPKYDVDTHIVLQVEPINKPAVISEEITFIGKMIGSNGREYILPEADFTFGADSGYFSIDTGKTVNHQIETNYFDAEKEGQIYFTIDNETATCDVYSYERKTEVILDEIQEIPINYQISVGAKVQSCADVYYTFDKNNNVNKSTKVINNGHVLFYINDKQVGYSPVQDGYASTTVFFTNKYYTTNTYHLRAVYKPNTYYFSSDSSVDFNVIEETNVCFVSSNGDDTANGTYGTPFKTIKKAINANKAKIFLLDDNYTETNINITHNVELTSFKNHTTFKSLIGTSLFNIASNVKLTISNIDFIKNNLTIFNNQGTVTANKCIFYNNDTLFSEMNNADIIKYCAIVDNVKICNSIKANCFIYCWFGKNQPNINGLNDYVQMTYETSKDKVYIGSLVHIAALLNTYRHNDRFNYILETPLPLRIAKFATTYGSMKPVKDYTYNNKSTSLLNTNEDNNTNKYLLNIIDEKHYSTTKITLSCNVTNVYDEEATGNVSFVLSNQYMNYKQKATLVNGIATMTIDRLNVGTYSLTCSYEKDKQMYTITKNIQVQRPEIVVKTFDILDGDNLYRFKTNIELEDNFGNPISKQNIKFYIDNNYIKTIPIMNGQLIEAITYNKIPSGQHYVKIVIEDEKYEPFEYEKALNVNTKNVNIIFPYSQFEKNISNNIDIKIIDDEGTNVDGGYINIELDNENIASDVNVINGNVNISDFIIHNDGQHTITIYYTGVEHYYNEKLYINSKLGVGIFNVIFDIQDYQYLRTDIGKPFNFNTTIKDVGNQPVNHGYVNLYIDDILFNENPLNVNNGKVHLQQELPTNISSGTHTLRIEYIDITNTYLDTYVLTYLEIGKIPTFINMNVVQGAPGQYTPVDYQVSTTYGRVNTGVLKAFYNDIEIGSSNVTENTINQIPIKVPFVPATQDYTILFKYTSDSIYDDSTLENKLIINRNHVNITPSHDWYYPNQEFNFAASFTDADGNIINYGKASLYIDNVKETESKDVINGQMLIPNLIFNQARIYPMTVIYEDNDYFLESSYDFDFKIDSVDIDDISLREIDINISGDNITQKDDDIELTASAIDKNGQPLVNATINFYDDTNVDTTLYKPYYIQNSALYSLPNQTIECELSFVTLDNYNVKDGIVDIQIDGELIRSYYMAENNKHITFDIGALPKGEHNLELIYHDSSLFNSFNKHIPLHILSKQVLLTVNDGADIDVLSHNDEINIRTNIYDAKAPTNHLALSGILRYYIGLPIYKAEGLNVIQDWDYRFIGVQEIDSQDEDIYSYKLPTELLEYSIDKFETQYKIKVEFIGNDEYDAAEATVPLKLHKQTCNLTFNHIDNKIDANYRDSIDILFNIDAEGTPLVNLYIDNDLIGTVIAKDNAGALRYKLNAKYTVKEGSQHYTLRAVFSGSAVDSAAEDSIDLYVHPLMPNINMEPKSAYYGGKLKLDNIITDVDGAFIDSGELHYKINNEEEEYTFTPNTEATINMPTNISASTATLKVRYNASSQNYSDFNKTITINMKKNDITISHNAPKEMYRATDYNVQIVGTCSTSTLPVTVSCNGFNMTNGIGNTTLSVPLLNNNNVTQDTHTFHITSTPNTYFNAIDKDITVKIIDKDKVILDKNATESSSSAQSLTRAINLVAPYGTIQVNNAPINQEVTIEKPLTITGNGQQEVTNWKITNSSDITIKNITFKNSATNAIINNAECIVDNCKFNNGENSAILTNGKIEIAYCGFTGNHAENGSCIYISNKNYNTYIHDCSFKQNNVDFNGSCIYSNKGNDINIVNNEFANNNGTNNVSSSICINGNAYISSNMFYQNNYESEIYLLDGTISMDNNIFDGAIKTTKIFKGAIDADYNYFGYNDIHNIESNNSDIITINNWLISSREDYNKVINGVDKAISRGVIKQVTNRLEKEILTIDKIDKEFPITVGTRPAKLNDEVENATSAVIIIGQERLGGE